MVGRSDIRVFSLCRMVEIKWRERDCNLVSDASLQDGGVSRYTGPLWVTEVHADFAYVELGFADANFDQFLGCY